MSDLVKQLRHIVAHPNVHFHYKVDVDLVNKAADEIELLQATKDSPVSSVSGAALTAKAAVLRARGKNNTLHDINQSADYLDAAAAMIGTQQEPKP